MDNRNATKPVRVFISYRHANTSVMKDLRTSLGWLENNAQITVFDDRNILAGDDWDQVIRKELSEADIIILVVTAGFMASNYCKQIELKQALKRRAEDGIRIIPIIAEYCDWQSLPIGDIAALPKDDKNNIKPLNKWRGNNDVALTQIAEQVKRNVERVTTEKPRFDKPSDGSLLELPASGSGGGEPSRPVDGALDIPAPTVQPRAADFLNKNFSDVGDMSYPFFCGREQELLTLKDLLLGQQLLPIVVVGPDGIGKSSLCKQVLGKPEIISRFKHRFHIRLHQCKTAASAVAEIARTIQVPNLGEPLDVWPIVRFLESKPTLLILDDAHCVWNEDKEHAVAIFHSLEKIPQSTFIAVFRGYAKPHRVHWADPIIELRPLNMQESRELFLTLCKNIGRDFTGDPFLDKIVHITDRVPLAITWMAKLAEPCLDLEEMYNRWRKEGVDAFEDEPSSRPERSLHHVLSSSILDGPLTESERHLLWILSYLPAGLPFGGLVDENNQQVFPWYYKGRDVLLRFGRVFKDCERIRLPTPVREYVGKHISEQHTEYNSDLKKLVNYFLRFACHGNCIGFSGVKISIKQLEDEYSNIEVMIRVGLGFPDPEFAIHAAIAFGRYQRFVGAGTIGLLDEARQAAVTRGLRNLQAECFRVMASMQRQRGRLEPAQHNYLRAQELYYQDRNVLGQAQCARGLADTFRKMYYAKEARKRYAEAYRLYRQAQRRSDGQTSCPGFCSWTLTARHQVYRGSADCLKRVGDLVLAAGRRAKARHFYHYANRNYEKVGDCLGQAHCIKGLGDVDMGDKLYGSAHECYKRAQDLYQNIPYLRGVADCVYSRGDLAVVRVRIVRKEYYLDEVHGYYEKARQIYDRLYEEHGLANCTYSFGDIYLLESYRKNQAPEEAEEYYLRALATYEHLGDVLGRANCLMGLADVTRLKGDEKELKRYKKELWLLRRAHASISQSQVIIHSFGPISTRWRGG